jgi:hypothetical protein
MGTKIDLRDSANPSDVISFKEVPTRVRTYA